MPWEPTSVDQLDGFRARVTFTSDAWPQWRVVLMSGVLFDVTGPRPYVDSMKIESTDPLRQPPQRLLDGLKAKHLYSTAQQIAQELEREADDDRPPLPEGVPRRRVNNDGWYRRFARTVDAWRTLGLPMGTIDEEIAQRKGVDPETVRKWRRRAQLVAVADDDVRPTAAGTCSRCGGPVAPGAVGALQDPASGAWSIYHPTGCAEKWHDRMVLTPDGEVLPL